MTNIMDNNNQIDKTNNKIMIMGSNHFNPNNNYIFSVL